MSLPIDEIIAVLNDTGITPDKVKAVRVELEKLEEEKKADRQTSATPKSKNQFVIVLSDPENKITQKDLTGWVLQIPEGDDVNTTLDRIRTASIKQNTTMKKFIKKPLKSVGDAFQNLKRKFTKVEKVLVKTPNAVSVIVTDNTL